MGKFFAIFDQKRRLSRKRYEIGPWLLRTTNRQSQVADLSVSVPMTSIGLKKRDAMVLVDLSNYARIVSHRTTKFGHGTQVGRSVFPGVSHVPMQRGEPSVPQIYGTSYMREHGMSNSKQILHGDQIRREENFTWSTTSLA